MAAVLDRREANLAGELEDVAWVRHAVAGWLRGWDLAGLVEDVELVASELTTNAILHAGGAVDVVLERRGSGVRVVVHDRRPDVVPVAPAQPAFGPGDGSDDRVMDQLARSLFERTTTGRGLLLVEAFSDAWGVEIGVASKGVWAELGTGGLATAEVTGTASAGGGRRDPPEEVGVPVRLTGVPVRLVLLSAANTDDLVRELQTTAFDARAPSELALLGERLARETTAHREPLRAAARAALARREAVFDLSRAVPASQVIALRGFVALTGQVERFCRQGVLLAGAPTAEVTAFRRWYVEEVARQVGGEPAAPCPFPG